MHTDSEERTIVSCLGWIDGGSLWVLDVATAQSRTIQLKNAKYLSIHSGRSDHFAVSHHYDGGHVAITVHCFSDPKVVLAQCEISSTGQCRIDGQSDIWVMVPRYYVAYLVQPAWSDYVLITLDLTHGPTLQTFDWYDESYDKGYQGIIGVSEIPESDGVIISVQRSSTLINYDPRSKMKTCEFSLSGRSGNPQPYFRQTAAELWVDDYDTLLKIQPHSWKILEQRRLQAAKSGVGKFVGEFVFNKAETICAVARPFSGDVVGLDTETFEIRCRAKVGKQPLEVASLSDGTVFARDWQSGALLKGSF